MALFTSVTVHTLDFTVASGSSYTSKLFRVLFGTELLKGHKAHLRGREGERERRCVRSIEAYYNAFFFFWFGGRPHPQVFSRLMLCSLVLNSHEREEEK